MNNSKISKQKYGKYLDRSRFGLQFEVQIENNFGFILTAKFGFLFAKLNLSLSLGVVLKNSTEDKKDFYWKKICFIAYQF